MALLEVRGLVKRFGRRTVVDGVAFEVNAGEVVGLLGPNGAGKTTSFRMATGQITPNAGHVFFNGQDVTDLPMYLRARLGMGYLAQETSVFRKLTCEQNILAILEMMPVSRTLGRPLTRRERRLRTEEVLEKFGLVKVRRNLSARLSGGEKRRLEIARCLVCEPLLILLDEPFTGIDPITIAEIRTIVKDLRNQGIGVLLTDHNVHEALRITSRSYLIKDGKVRTQGTPSQIVSDPIAIAEYLGASFSDLSYEQQAGIAAPTAPSAPVVAPPPEKPAVDPIPIATVLEQEKVQRLIEGLKSNQHQAIADLTARGPAVVPYLLSALERRDVEIRRSALTVMQNVLKRSLPFDPYAPESVRRQQLDQLRTQFERKAG